MKVRNQPTLRRMKIYYYCHIGRIFESEIILIPPSLKISESSSNGIRTKHDKGTESAEVETSVQYQDKK
jgi:hypothetical protein